jgi:sensor histidine kinase YesM
MKLFSGKLTALQLQQAVWVSVFVVIMLSLLPMDPFGQAFAYAIIYTAFYAAIIYGNILWLFPKLYQKGRIVWYVLSVIVFLFAVGIIRGFITLTVYNTFFAPKPQEMTFKVLSSFIVGGILIFLLSFIFRIAIAYFDLKRQSEEIIVQKTQAELNLLKSQVQPHFLFNTLNNIYYEAYLEAPRTAALIERLSNIMRYFVDESPKQLVSLATEILFIENYIELEKIRIRYDISLNFTKNCDAALSIPPMLLMAFVENVFKHGIDKSSVDNRINLALTRENDRLLFTVENTLPDVPLNPNSTGSGIGNLRKRLILLYQNDFELSTQNNGDIYHAHLNIPLK